MGQYWKIFNISKGKAMFLYDAAKYCEKSIEIDILLYLLQNDWKDNKIVMIGDYDQTVESAQFATEFLEKYGLTTIDKDDYTMNNLFLLHSEDLLPKSAYRGSKLDMTYMNIELQRKIISYFQSIGKLKKDTFYYELNPHYFILDKHQPLNEDNLIEYKPLQTEDEYAFIDHTSKEYVLFNVPFFHGFYDTRTKKALTMSIIQYNHLVQDIVLGLITNNSEFKDKLSWHGRFAGHKLSFEKMEQFAQHNLFSEYTNISELFISENVDKNTIYRDTSNILYTENPKADLDISDDEE